jgi:hypothetical protein
VPLGCARCSLVLSLDVRRELAESGGDVSRLGEMAHRNPEHKAYRARIVELQIKPADVAFCRPAMSREIKVLNDDRPSVVGPDGVKGYSK